MILTFLHERGRHYLTYADKVIKSYLFTRTVGNVTKTVYTNNATVATSLKVKFDHTK